MKKKTIKPWFSKMRSGVLLLEFPCDQFIYLVIDGKEALQDAGL